MPASTGINRDTGEVLTDLDHARQSLVVIFATHIGTRVMRRIFGSAVPALLGRNLTPAILDIFVQAISLAIYLWEPRFANIEALYPAPPNAPSTMRLGGITMAILADYRPYALDGDFTTDVQRVFL